LILFDFGTKMFI